MCALSIAKNMTEAAKQSASQCKQTRSAQRKAIQEEQAEKVREEKRKHKEAQQAEKKAAEALKREKEKKDKQIEAAAKSAEKAAQEAIQNDGHGQEKRRRGKGADELGDAHPVLTTKFENHEVAVFDTLAKFRSALTTGMPIIWRARRAPFKKVMEAHSTLHDLKAIGQAVLLIRSEFKQQVEEFVDLIQKNPNTIKKPRVVGDEAQALLEPLSLDVPAQEQFEWIVNHPDEAQDSDPPYTVMERAVFQQVLDEVMAGMSFPDDKSKNAAEQEVGMYKLLHQIGFKKGELYSGYMQGMWPHVLYQQEGSRAVAFVSVDDALQLHLMQSCLTRIRCLICL